MIYKHVIEGALEQLAGPDGAGKEEFELNLASAGKAIAKLAQFHKDKSWPVLTIAEREDDLGTIESAAGRIRDNFDTLVVLGMGASSRGGSTLVALAQNQYTGLAGG